MSEHLKKEWAQRRQCGSDEVNPRLDTGPSLGFDYEIGRVGEEIDFEECDKAKCGGDYTPFGL